MKYFLKIESLKRSSGQFIFFKIPRYRTLLYILSQQYTLGITVRQYK